MDRLLIDYGATRCRYRVERAGGDEEGEFRSGSEDLESFIGMQVEKCPLIKAVHIAYAGQVVEGEIVCAPNIRADHRGLRSRIESVFKIPVKIENDLKCAALAEYHNKEGCTSLIVAYIGTGFGAAALEEGRLVRGVSNMAGEVGHIPYKKAPFLCGCGKDDCIEIYCSGTALAQWIAYYGVECAVTLEAIEGCADENARRISENFYGALTHALSTLITVFNPAYVILGGSVVTQNRAIITKIEDRLRAHTFPPALNEVKIEMTHLNNGCLEGTQWL